MGPGREAGTRRLAQAICAQAAFSSRDLGAVSSPPPLSLRYLPLRYAPFSGAAKTGRASGRERGCQTVKISVVAVPLKKKKYTQSTTQTTITTLRHSTCTTEK